MWQWVEMNSVWYFIVGLWLRHWSRLGNWSFWQTTGINLRLSYSDFRGNFWQYQLLRPILVLSIYAWIDKEEANQLKLPSSPPRRSKRAMKNCHLFQDLLAILLTGNLCFNHMLFCSETILLVNLCNALAFGLIQQWIPTDKPTKEVMQSPPPSPTRNSSPSRKAKSVASHHSGKSKTVLVDPKGMDDIKAALEVS